MKSHWVKGITTSGTLCGVAIDGTELVREITQRHRLIGLGAKGLGEAALGALLLASSSKPGERINLNIEGSGYYKRALIDASPAGKLRGYVVVRETAEAQSVLEGRNLGPWGEGTLSVLRTKDFSSKIPSIGTVPLVTGHLAKDLTFYWAQSEQVASAVRLSVVMDERGELSAASGFLIQALPGSSENEVNTLEHRVLDLQRFVQNSSEPLGPVQVLSRIFQDNTLTIIEDRELVFECSCSRQRVETALSLLGREELAKILLEDKGITITCEFCIARYSMNEVELGSLLETMQKK